MTSSSRRLYCCRRVLIGVLAIACALSVFSLVGCSALDAEEVSVSIESAQEAYDTADFAAAVDELTLLIANEPDNLAARELLALALAATGENDAAIEQYAYVIEKNPAAHESLYRAAVLERLVGSPEAAITHLEAAVELDGNPTYLDDLARTYMQVGRYEDAATAWGRLLSGDQLETEGRVEILRVQADAYQNAKDYDSAIASLEEAVALAPNDEALQARLDALK